MYNLKMLKRKGALLALAAIIFLLGTSLTYLHIKNAFSKTQQPPQLFQPEVQMLSADTQPNTTAHVILDATTTSLSNIPGYTYSSSTCLNATGTDGEYSCFSTYYKELVANHGVDIAFTDIKTRYSQMPFVQTDCHPLMHIIGQAAFLLYPTISEAYLHGDSFCWSGYYHGILEGYAFKVGKDNLPSLVNTVCADIPGKNIYSFDYYNCVHGLGHGIMELNDDDVPVSLGICDGLIGTWEQESCYSGIFMENIVHDSLEHDSKYLKTSDLLYPCDWVADKYKESCYIGQTSYALEKSNYDFTKISTLCTTVAEPYRDICFQSYGRDAAGGAQNDPAKIKSLCDIPTVANDVTNCVVGALKELISYFHSDVQMKTFCNLLDEPSRDYCLATGKSYYEIF